jgi:hypothetical protein
MDTVGLLLEGLRRIDETRVRTKMQDAPSPIGDGG